MSFKLIHFFIIPISRLATFITNTFIRDSSGRTIKTREGFYDLKNHRAQFGKRPTITDKAETITADMIQFDDSTGISTARGNAVFRDTVQNLTLISNLMIANKKTNSFLATQNPLIILKQDKDSIYITGDTVYSAHIPDSVLKTPDSVQGMPIRPHRQKPERQQPPLPADLSSCPDIFRFPAGRSGQLLLFRTGFHIPLIYESDCLGRRLPGNRRHDVFVYQK